MNTDRLRQVMVGSQIVAIVVLAIAAFVVWRYKQTGQSIAESGYEFITYDATKSQQPLSELLSERKPVFIGGVGVPHVWTYKAIAESEAVGMAVLNVQHTNKTSSGEKGGSVSRIKTRSYLSELKHATDASRLNVRLLNSLDVAESLHIGTVMDQRTLDVRGLWLLWATPDLYMVGIDAPVYGLRHVVAEWAVVIPTEGNVYVTLGHPDNSLYLPSDPTQLSNIKIWSDEAQQENPLLAEVSFVDVIVRPGMKLMIPAHWYFAIRAHTEPVSPEEDNDDDLPVSMGLVGYIHSPVSKLASMLHGAP